MMDVFKSRASLYARYWKRDRDIVFPNLFKKLIIVLISTFISVASCYVFLAQRSSLNRYQAKLLKLQYDEAEINEIRTIHLRNQDKIKRLDEKHFLGDFKESQRLRVWKEVSTWVAHPLKEDFEWVSYKPIMMLAKRPAYSLMTSELTVYANFLNANEFSRFWNQLNGLPATLYENECIFNRIHRESLETLKSKEPFLGSDWETKCVIGLFWIQKGM